MSDRQRPAPRFSDSSLQVLLQAVRERREVLFPADGIKRPCRLTKAAWTEVAVEVSDRGVHARTWVQCRKRVNDLLRSAREKQTHNALEKANAASGVTDMKVLTLAEDEAIQLAGEDGCRVIADGEAGTATRHRHPKIRLQGSWKPEDSSSGEDDANVPEEPPSPASSAASPRAVTPIRSAEGPHLQSGAQPGQQLRGAMTTGLLPDTRRTAGHQAPGKPLADEEPLVLATKSLLDMQQKVGEHMAEMPEVMRGFARAMEESVHAMTSAMSQVCERMASSMERVATAMEGQVEQSTHMRSELHSIAVTMGSVQQWLSERGARHPDLPPGVPSLQGDRWAPSCTQMEEGVPAALGPCFHNSPWASGLASSLLTSSPLRAAGKACGDAPAPGQETPSKMEPSRPQTCRGRPPRSSKAMEHHTEQVVSTSDADVGVTSRCNGGIRKAKK